MAVGGKVVQIICVALLFIYLVHGKSLLRIVGGDLADIEKNPHAAALVISCKHTPRTKVTLNFVCGSSILNQLLLLTAGHCLYRCVSSTDIAVTVGSNNKFESTHEASTFVVHSDYLPSHCGSDIALVKVTRKLKFGPMVQRVVIVPYKPKTDTAVLSGWGLIDEVRNISTVYLITTTQRLISRTECMNVLKNVPEETFCGQGVVDYGFGKHGYAAMGDSGSGLIAKSYILIGIVSYKEPLHSNTTVVYTDVAHFYSWISTESKRLYCNHDK